MAQLRNTAGLTERGHRRLLVIILSNAEFGIVNFSAVMHALGVVHINN